MPEGLRPQWLPRFAPNDRKLPIQEHSTKVGSQPLAARHSVDVKSPRLGLSNVFPSSYGGN